MPRRLEKKLRARAKKMKLSKKRANAYVFGTLRKTGWTPSHQKKKTGRRKRQRMGG